MKDPSIQISFESPTEALSVPAFYRAYRELGDKYKLWEKSLDSLVSFFDELSPKNLRRILRAFGMRANLNEDRLQFYAGGSPGLLSLNVPIPPEARATEGPTYVCPHFQHSLSTYKL